MAEHFQFGPVLDQNKQPNWIFKIFFEPNRTEPKTSSNWFILIWFGFFLSKPVQTKIIPVSFF